MAKQITNTEFHKGRTQLLDRKTTTLARQTSSIYHLCRQARRTSQKYQLYKPTRQTSSILKVLFSLDILINFSECILLYLPCAKRPCFILQVECSVQKVYFSKVVWIIHRKVVSVCFFLCLFVYLCVSYLCLEDQAYNCLILFYQRDHNAIITYMTS